MQSATTSAGATALATQYNNLRLDVLLGGDYATSGGSADVQTLSLDAQITSYVNGMLVHFRSGFTTTTRTPTLNINSIGAKTMKKFDRSALFVGEIIANASVIAVYDSTDDSFLILSNTDKDTPPYGDESDGSLSITSGTTTLNESTRNVYQYKDVSITGTGALAIGSNHQNKRVFILVNGDLTVTSSTNPAVDGRGRGGSGATGAISHSAVNGTAGKGIQKVSSSGGIGGSTSTGPATFNAPGGGGGASCVTAGSTGENGSGGTGMVAGVGGGTGLLVGATSSSPINLSHWLDILGCGDGGGAGCGSTGGSRAGGDGGAGGGCIIFLVRGNINITSTFNVSGSNGSDGTNNGSNYYTGGGGGGGGGSLGIFYKGSVTANTATLTVSGGSGGLNALGSPGTGDGGAGGAGIALVKQIEVLSFHFLVNG